MNLRDNQLSTQLVLSSALILLLVGSGLATGESQKAWLRLNVANSRYVGASVDSWLEDSYVVSISPTASSVSLNITVENIRKDRDVCHVVLLVVSNDTSVVDQIIVNDTTTYPGASWNTGTVSMTSDEGEDLGELPPHGVYNDPAAFWIEYRSGENLTATTRSNINVNVTIIFKNPGPGTMKIHFDAYGWTEESGKQPVIIDDSLDASFAPFSHDFTVTVPELSFPLLAATSLGVCGYLLIKRKLATT